MPMETMLALPPELTICTVSDLQQQLLAAPLPPTPDEDDACLLDGSTVDAVDAAGLQLLVSFANYLSARQRTLRVVGASEALANACGILGLASLLAPGNDTEAVA